MKIVFSCCILEIHLNLFICLFVCLFIYSGGKKDDRPKLEEMSKKDRKLVRRKENPNYELSAKAKKIWEKLRE